MKALLSPRVRIVPSRSTAKNSAGRLLAWMIAGAFLAVILPGVARADDESATISKLADAGMKCPEYAKEIAKIVKDNPKDAESIMVLAVKAKPACACEVVRQGITALGKYDTANSADVLAHSKLVASIVAAIVSNLQKTNPDVLDSVVQCSIDIAPDAKNLILDAIAGIYNGPPGGTTGNFTNGVSNPAFSPTPTPVPTPKPTTPTQNI